MGTEEDCQCDRAQKLIFPCSGSADVGEIADRASRVLTRDGAGKMSCLAGIGGGVRGMIESAKGASRILAIDGCPIDCARKTLEKAGISSFVHIRVTDHGMGKGHMTVTDETVKASRIRARSCLRAADGYVFDDSPRPQMLGILPSR